MKKIKPINYDHKPTKINTVDDLIKFVKGIPARAWCVDLREEIEHSPGGGMVHTGRCCILGHLDKAFGSSFNQTDGFQLWEIAAINNGANINVHYGNIHRRTPDVKTTGTAIKNRLLKALRKHKAGTPVHDLIQYANSPA